MAMPLVCTIHGDVWLVSGIDDKLAKLTWRRFATGLFQPLGLRVVGGKIFVLGRDQITRLHDPNGDGEADFYENFCNLIATSTGGHDYVTSLEIGRRRQPLLHRSEGRASHRRGRLETRNHRHRLAQPERHGRKRRREASSPPRRNRASGRPPAPSAR